MHVLLRQYEEQIDKVANLYEFLEQMQLPTTPCSGRRSPPPPTEEHSRAVLYGFRERADTISQSLLDLDAEMAALQRNIDKETEMLHGRLDGVEFCISGRTFCTSGEFHFGTFSICEQ